jgi:hypothetical protein
MLRVFTRRPRTVRPQVRAPLRLEALEARTNPAAPALVGLSADWSGNTVALSGRIVDETPANAKIQVAGAALGEFQVNENGDFFVLLKANSADGVYLRAADTEDLVSTSVNVDHGEDIVPFGSAPSLRDITISQEEDGWHIRGRLDGGDPNGAIIRIIRGPGDSNGVSGGVDEDGSFDIIIQLPPDASGGISIIGIGGDGSESDPWNDYMG